MARLVTSIAALSTFSTFGTQTKFGGARGKSNGVSHGMAATQFTFWGYQHLVGQTVSTFVGGLDCGDYTVAADGSVVVPVQSDPDKLLTEAYLAGLDGPDYGEAATFVTLNGLDSPITVSIPVVIGLAFTTRGQLLRPTSQEEIKSPQGPGLAKTRRLYQVGALLHNTVGVYIGTDFGTTLEKMRLPGPTGVAQASNILYNGVAWGLIQDSYTFDGMISWQMLRPYPVTVCSLAGFVEVEDR